MKIKFEYCDWNRPTVGKSASETRHFSWVLKLKFLETCGVCVCVQDWDIAPNTAAASTGRSCHFQRSGLKLARIIFRPSQIIMFQVPHLMDLIRFLHFVDLSQVFHFLDLIQVLHFLDLIRFLHFVDLIQVFHFLDLTQDLHFLDLIQLLHFLELIRILHIQGLIQILHFLDFITFPHFLNSEDMNNRIMQEVAQWEIRALRSAQNIIRVIK